MLLSFGVLIGEWSFQRIPGYSLVDIILECGVSDSSLTLKFGLDLLMLLLIHLARILLNFIYFLRLVELFLNCIFIWSSLMLYFENFLQLRSPELLQVGIQLDHLHLKRVQILL